MVSKKGIPMRKSTFCLAVASLVACPGHATVASAHAPAWTSIGPAGAYLKVLAIDPWTPTTLYAGMVEDDYHPQWGVYKSDDGGGTWNAVNTGMLDGFAIFALAIDPVTPSTLYAGLGGYDGGPGGGGVFKSMNGGGTWSPVNTGLSQNIGVLALAIDPITPLTLYAGTDAGGVFKSIDGGGTWSNANIGLSSDAVPSANLAIFSLAIDPVTTSTLYAGTYLGGVFKSIDRGGSWNAINTGLPTEVVFSVLAIDPMNSSTLYAGKGTYWGGAGGVFKSVDGGGTWNDITSGLPTDVSIHAVTIDPWTTSTLYVGSFGGGVFISRDGGNSWSDFNAGLTDRLVHAIAVNPLTPTTVYAGTCSNGVFVLGSS
jgi:photosystem II stability/assembly factor-like uncharacterized protein